MSSSTAFPSTAAAFDGLKPASRVPEGTELGWAEFLACMTVPPNCLPTYEGNSCDLDDDSTLPPVGTKEYALEVYRRKGYLPSLLHPREEERLAVLSLYGLDKINKFPLDTLTKLAKNVFQCDSIVVDVVTEDKVHFVASSGWSETELNDDEESPEVDLEIGYHAMLKSPAEGVWVMPDTGNDVRFKKNPLSASAGGPIGFFASANINLATEKDPNDRLPVGSFCLLSKQPRPALTELEESMLLSFASMATKEFELAFQMQRNKRASERNAFIQALFRNLLIYPSRSLDVKERTTLDDLARQVGSYTSAEFTFILDARAFNYDSAPSALEHLSFRSSTSATQPPLVRRPSSESTSSLSDLPRVPQSFRRDAAVHGLGEVTVMDAWCSLYENEEESAAAWQAKHKGTDWAGLTNLALSNYHLDQRTTFSSSDADAFPFASVLPSNTTSVCCVPVFDHAGELALVLVSGSTQRHFTFSTLEEEFIGGVGAIVLGSLLQSKILAADQAKLAFVSQVSHELRTPLFSISGNVELVRQLLPPEALKSVASFLDVADVSLTTLKEVLNDVLEFSKLSNQTQSNTGALTGPARSPTDLNDLGVDLIKSCWSQARQYVALHDDGAEEVEQTLEVFFESNIEPGTIGNIDVGGLKRVLINLFGNALKFTSKGHITLRISEVPSTLDSTRTFRFSVIDSGRGMTAEFIRDSLFTPFAQENSFSCGAGLGVSLSAQLVGRMGGRIEYQSEIGKGTEATVTIPIEIISSPSSSTHSANRPSFLRRNLSEELSGRITQLPSPSPSPSLSHPVSSTPPPPPPPPPSTAAKPRSSSVKRRLDADASTASPSPLKVLVVDDNAIARRVLSMWLKTKKYQYFEAGGGAEAVRLFKQEAPNLIWCDIQMPEVDGIEATRQMRAWEDQEGLSRSRIIALSGLDSTLGGNEAVLLSGQVDHWIVKGGSSLRQLQEDMKAFELRLFAERERIAESTAVHAALDALLDDADSDMAVEVASRAD